MDPRLILVIAGLILAFVSAIRYVIKNGFSCAECDGTKCSTCNALNEYRKKLEQ